MSKYTKFNVEKFTFEGKEYETFVRFPYGLAGRRKLDECCEDLVLQTRSGANIHVQGRAQSARQKFVRDIADFCVTTSPNFHQIVAAGEPNDSSWVLPDGQKADHFQPVTVPGTSGGSIYYCVAITKVGNIAFCHGPLTGPCRIRISLNKELVAEGQNLWSPKDRILSSKNSGVVFQTMEYTHMSYSPHVIKHSIAVVARGLDALFNVQKI